MVEIGINRDTLKTSVDSNSTKEKEVIGYTKNELDSIENEVKEKKEFELMKKSIEELDKIKEKINSLNIPDNIKLKMIDGFKDLVYERDNSEEKYNALKSINDMLDNIGNMKFKNISDIKDYVNSYIADLPETTREIIEGDASVSLYLSIIAVLIVGFGTVVAETGLFLLIGIGAVFIFSAIKLGSIFFRGEYDDYTKQKLFDILNDIYPQINQKEFDKIYELYNDGKFDLTKFSIMMNKYEEDGKITKEERVKIDQFLQIESSQ